MEVPSRVRFVDEAIGRAFQGLEAGKPEERELKEWLEQALANIEKNAFCGIQIPKKLIPKEYISKYGVTNLWKYNLPNAWRLLYSIENQQVCIVSIVLEWMNHKDYERKFNY